MFGIFFTFLFISSKFQLSCLYLCNSQDGYILMLENWWSKELALGVTFEIKTDNYWNNFVNICHSNLKRGRYLFTIVQQLRFLKTLTTRLVSAKRGKVNLRYASHLQVVASSLSEANICRLPVHSRTRRGDPQNLIFPGYLSRFGSWLRWPFGSIINLIRSHFCVIEIPILNWKVASKHHVPWIFQLHNIFCNFIMINVILKNQKVISLRALFSK